MSLFKRKERIPDDYKRSMLPSTRWEVFWDVFKLQWRTLLKIGSILIVFALPFVVGKIGEITYISQLYGQLPDTPTAEQLNAVTYSVAGFDIMQAAVAILFMLLIGVALSGILRIIRQLAWEEPVMFISDFSIGVRQNIKQVLAVQAIVSIGNLVATYLYHMSQFSEGVAKLVLIIPGVLLCILAGPILAYLIVIIPVYGHKLGANLKIALLLYMKRPGKTLLAFLCAGACFALQFVPDAYFQTSGILLSCLLLPFALLGWTLFAYNYLDCYINADNYPALVGKGITHKINKK